MRLKPEVRGLIVKLCRQHFGADARVWLFGSRLDDKALGGDIDLYIETTLAQERWLRAEATFIWDFFSAQGQQNLSGLGGLSQSMDGPKAPAITPRENHSPDG